MLSYSSEENQALDVFLTLYKYFQYIDRKTRYKRRNLLHFSVPLHRFKNKIIEIWTIQTRERALIVLIKAIRVIEN